MATQRYISTSFWTDKWIRNLDPSERYLYMYLLTNPQTNIAGVYQITIDRIAFDTGYDERTLKPMLDRFAESGKAYFYNDEWIILPTWPKHQRISKRDNNRKGIDSILISLPDDVFNKICELNYNYIFLNELGRGLQGSSRESNYINSDTDSDSNSDADTKPIHILFTTKWFSLLTKHTTKIRNIMPDDNIAAKKVFDRIPDETECMNAVDKYWEIHDKLWFVKGTHNFRSFCANIDDVIGYDPVKANKHSAQKKIDTSCMLDMEEA